MGNAIKKKFRYGYIKTKKDGMAELTVTGFTPVKTLLTVFLPCLRIKKPLAKLVLEIIDKYKQVNTEADFLEVCLLIDKTAEFMDSKNRKNTYFSVKKYLEST